MCERLLAVQAQDPRGARLAIRARTAGLTAADVDRALDDRALLVTWLNRGTLHLVRSEDYALLQPLTTPQLRAGSERRLAQEGVTPAALRRGLTIVTTALADGPQTREELRERLRRGGVPTAGQALIHVLFRAAIEGLVVRGPMRGKQHCYVLVADWLGPQPAFGRDAALAELARRYLAGHAPAGDRDLAKWAGITLGDARRALAAARPPKLAADPPPVPLKLLGAFDELLMGWADRSWVLPERVAPQVISGGLFRPSVLARGRVTGAWGLGDGGQVELAGSAPRGLARVLRAEAADVERFLAP